MSGLIKNPSIGGSSNPRFKENGRIYSIKTHRHGKREDDEIKEKKKSYLWPFILLQIRDRFIDQQPLNLFTTSLHQSAFTARDGDNGCIHSIKTHRHGEREDDDFEGRTSHTSGLSYHYKSVLVSYLNNQKELGGPPNGNLNLISQANELRRC